MKRFNKRSKIIFSLIICTLLFIFFCVIVGVYCGNKRFIVKSYKNEKISFYYRDTLLLDSVFPQFSHYQVKICGSPHIVLNDKKLYFPNPECIDTTDLKLKISFFNGSDSTYKTVYVRCWIDGKYSLNECTDNPIWEASKFKHYYDVFRNLLGKKSRETIVALGDTLYSTLNGRFELISEAGIKECSSLELESFEYNQAIRGGEFQFLRTENKLYVSKDDFRNYKLIYDDRRGIKESMYWDVERNRLVFSMYTPGSVRLRHYLISYDPVADKLDTLQTFYTSQEHKNDGKTPYCRHIHLICKDPYSGYMFIGIGDYDDEPGIYYSKDGGETIHCLGKGNQLWRTLSFFFIEDYIFWTNDSESPQYINRISRSQLDNGLVDDKDVVRFPIFNSALWCNVNYNGDLYLVGSNSEGQFYDDFHRLYGLSFSEDGIPTVYNLIEEKSLKDKTNRIIYHQIAPLCVDFNGFIWCYDTHLGLRKFELKESE